MSQDLVQMMKRAIEDRGGFLSFAEWMQYVLYTPELGYYTSSKIPVGAAGDFTTAPMISPLFSRCLAYQCREVLQHLQEPVILECGAGSGDMAVDLLLALEKMDSLPQRYLILELGAGLKGVQYVTLASRCPHLLSLVEWIDRLPTNPVEGVILGNEVIDALPVVLFEWGEQGQVLERGVGCSNAGTFVWKLKLADQALTTSVHALHAMYGPWPIGYQSEVCLLLKPWLSAFNDCLKRGLLLWVDYGAVGAEYYHPAKKMGSVRSYEAHRLFDSPLEAVGDRDITADVDFSALASFAEDLGLPCAGYTAQALFLLNCQITHDAEQLIQAQPEQILKIQSGMRQLMHPQDMGTRFKVIALTKDYTHALCGFASHNQRVQL